MVATGRGSGAWHLDEDWTVGGELAETTCNGGRIMAAKINQRRVVMFSHLRTRLADPHADALLALVSDSRHVVGDVDHGVGREHQTLAARLANHVQAIVELVDSDEGRRRGSHPRRSDRRADVARRTDVCAGQTYRQVAPAAGSLDGRAEFTSKSPFNSSFFASTRVETVRRLDLRAPPDACYVSKAFRGLSGPMPPASSGREVGQVRPPSAGARAALSLPRQNARPFRVMGQTWPPGTLPLPPTATPTPPVAPRSGTGTPRAPVLPLACGHCSRGVSLGHEHDSGPRRRCAHLSHAGPVA